MKLCWSSLTPLKPTQISCNSLLLIITTKCTLLILDSCVRHLWNDNARKYKKDSCFWYKVWEEAGCPVSGVLSSIKRSAKRRYKYEVRHLKRRQQYLLRDRLACSFAMKKKDRFWSAVKKVNKPNASLSSIVDGVSGTDNITNLFASKFGALLNKHSSSSNSILDSIQCSLTDSHLRSILITPEQVLEALSQLKPDKTDPSGVSSKHLLYGSSVLAVPLSALFTSILRHGFMPDCLRDSILIPVPKSNKDSTKSLNYRPISLSSTLSKVLERLLLSVYEEFLSSSHLQFGFKRGFSTSLCTATIKNIVTNYLHRDSPVLGCFLDASKAFDLVDHGILFKTLLERGLPLSIVRFLISWYSMQQLRVRWNSSLSDPFKVSNGVRQGSVLSPILFSVYLDSLLVDLSKSGVGCYWGSVFAGAFAYADDVVLLAPCAAALRIMLSICSRFALSHKLEFNASKTKLICFSSRLVRPHNASIFFNNILLPYSKSITHLGHILSENLDDMDDDIKRVLKDLNCKANSILCTFHCADPVVKTFLIQSFCLSLYGGILWKLNTSGINRLEVALNKILRKIWHLPPRSHSSIVHIVAQVNTVKNLLYYRFLTFLKNTLSSPSPLVRSVFHDTCHLAYFFNGYNSRYGHTHLKFYNDTLYNYADTIRYVRIVHGSRTPFESLVNSLSCF